MSTLIEKDRTGVLELRLNRPQKRNALNQELVERLTAAFVKAAARDEVRVVLLSAEGSVFSAGADLDALRALQNATRTDNERDSALMAALFRSIVDNPKPVIARVHGHAIAGGCGLVAACDLAVASSDALLGFTEVKIGFVPAIVSAIASNRINGSNLRRLMLTGKLITATEAHHLGLVSGVAGPDELDDKLNEIIEELLGVSSQAVGATKRLLAEIEGKSFVEALELGTRANIEARQSDDCREGVAAFLDKRKPRWAAKGRKR